MLETRDTAPGAPSPLSRRARRQAEIRARLLAAGQTIFARQGVTQTTIAQITDLADVGFGTFYLYFETKEALYRAIVSEGFARLGAHFDALLRAARDRDDPWRVTLRAGIDLFFHFAADHRELFLVMFTGGEVEGLRMGGELRGRLASWVGSIVERASAAECRASDSGAPDLLPLLTASITATLRRSAFWWLRRSGSAAEEALPVNVVSARVADFVVAGLAGALCPEERARGQPK